jgi:hypothetical protein
MTFSNLLKSSIVVASLLLGACSTESNKTKEVGFNEPDRFPGEGNMRVKTISAGLTPSSEFNDYSVLTKRTFNLVACITDPLQAAVQAGLDFAVVDGSGNSIVKTTQSDGCINWQETHAFTFMAREAIFKVSRRIESRSLYSGYAIVTFGLNPWATGSGTVVDFRKTETFPANAPVVNIESLNMRGQSLNKPLMSDIGVKLSQASFQFVGLDKRNTEITPTLGLKLAHKYIFKITPQIVRKSIEKPVVLESISTGKMKVTFLILREDENPLTQMTTKNVLSSTEFEGEFVAGELTGTTSIKFENISELTSRTVVLLTLTPVTVFDGFPQVSFTGPIAPGRVGTLNLIPTQFDASEIHSQYIKKQNEFKAAELKPLQLFEKHSGFTRMVNVPAELQNWMNAYLAGQAPMSHRALSLACDQLLNGPGLARYRARCRMAPVLYLVYGKRSLVDSILTPNPKMSEVTTVDNFKMAWSQSSQYSDSTTLAANMKAGASLGLNLGFNGGTKFWTSPAEEKITTWGANFGGSVGLNFSLAGDFTQSWVKKKDMTSSYSATREQTVTAEGRRYQFDAMVRKCFSLSLSEEFITEFKAQNIVGNFRQFSCSNTVSKEKRNETYYLVNAKTGVDNSPASDNDANTSSQWRMVVRGPRMMNLFLDISSASFFEFVFSPVKGLDAESEYLNRFKELYPIMKQNQTEEFPGFLSDET